MSEEKDEQAFANERKILAERAILLAKPKNDLKAFEKVLLTFKIDAVQQYGLFYKNIERIIPAGSVCTVPKASPSFLGLLNFNTEIWPVLNSAVLLQIADPLPPRYFILCRKNHEKFAFGIAEINQSVELYEESPIQEATKEHQNAFIQSIYQGNIAILKIEAIFNVGKAI